MFILINISFVIAFMWYEVGENLKILRPMINIKMQIYSIANYRY
ncbi:hypothetical protein CLH_2750 [Clostridium botulinum E3 str. Alaska E43]|nr:hypothetical protein CLH_2750 [Clostridium botulinum E3 str. Alaska E43]